MVGVRSAFPPVEEWDDTGISVVIVLIVDAFEKNVDEVLETSAVLIG